MGEIGRMVEAASRARAVGPSERVWYYGPAAKGSKRGADPGPVSATLVRLHDDGSGDLRVGAEDVLLVQRGGDGAARPFWTPQVEGESR